MGPVPPELIVAARLTLVPLRPEHAAEMAPVLADPDLYTFTGGAPPQAAELRARFERWAAGPGDPALSWDNWVIQLCAHGALAGYVQATVTDAAGTLAAELAWVVGKPWQGRGIGSEAARALAGWLGQAPRAEHRRPHSPGQPGVRRGGVRRRPHPDRRVAGR